MIEMILNFYFLLAKGSVLNSTYRLRLVDTLVTHAKGVTKIPSLRGLA